MFLTEREGGSDLGNTVHCVARDLGDGRVQIDGEKWFCSNVDGEAIALLARPEGATEGSAGLGLYLVPGHLDDGARNHFTIRRLKDKLGTKSVPTAEVEFHGAIGYALREQHGDSTGSDARGLNRMMEMVNDSRFGVAMMGLGIARRSFLEAVIWAHHRRVRGRPLVDLPLVREQLVDLQAELEARSRSGSNAPSRRDVPTAIGCAGSSSPRPRRDSAVSASRPRARRSSSTAGTATARTGVSPGCCATRSAIRSGKAARTCVSSTSCARDATRCRARSRPARIDDVLATASGAPAFAGEAIAAVTRAATPSRNASMPCSRMERDESEARSAALATSLVRTVSAALLLERAPGDARKALVASATRRRHLIPDAQWGDHIAGTMARELLGYDAIDEETATKAAA